MVLGPDAGVFGGSPLGYRRSTYSETAVAFLSWSRAVHSRSPGVRGGGQEYQEIWSRDGSRIVEVIERLTDLPWESTPIRAIVFEGTSHSGYADVPMRLRASYPPATKQGTLVHELGHRIFSHLVPGNEDDHPFLFLYDAWVELWGSEFADAQVKVESARKGQVDYPGAWRVALAMTAKERARRWRSFVASRKPAR